jgi:hypothetical protein
MKTIIGLILHTFIMVLAMPIYIIVSIVKFNLCVIRDAWFQYRRHWVLVKEIFVSV